MTDISDFFLAALEPARRYWGRFLVLGILLMALGVVCIVKAQTATTFSILALGWILVISAVVWFVNAYFAFSWHGFLVYLLNGIIRGVIGYLLIRHPYGGAEGVTMLLAALFIVGGLFSTAGASFIRFPKWGWTVFAGLVSVVLGIVLVISWPLSSTFFFGLAIGIDLIFDGGALAAFAGALHSVQVRTF
jgi:uncharacterized membrane protein HdeD (DUF308 family)